MPRLNLAKRSAFTLAIGMLCLTASAGAQTVPNWTLTTPDVQSIASTLDPSNNVLAAGSTATNGMVLTKVSPAGAQLWQREFSGVPSSRTSSVAVDSAGNALHVGMVVSPDNRPVGSVLVKYGPDGSLVWQDIVQDTWGYGWRATADTSGNVYLLSRMVKAGNPNADESVLTKLSPAGTRLWTRPLGIGSLSGDSIVRTSAGHIVVAGASAVAGQSTIAAYDGAGTLVWTTNLASTSDVALAVGPSGELYAVGSSGGFLITKYSATFAPLWTRTIAARGGAMRAKVDTAGNVIVSGQVDANTSMAMWLRNDWQTMKFDPNGTLLWSRNFGDAASDDVPNALVLGADNAVYLAGQGALQLAGSTTLTPSMATVKYDAAGTLLWSHSAFPSAQAYGLNIGSDSGVYVVGGGIVVVGQPAQTVLRYSPTGLANQAPIARATATPSAGAAPLNVTFSAAGSSDPDGTIASYTWNFGDGTTSSAPNPVHAYAAGSFSATLTVQDTLGASNTSAPVAINASAQPARPVSLALTSSSVVGTSSTMATLTLSSTSGATVRLASSNTKVATVPASVVVPAGAKTAVFSVKTARVSRATTVTISATANAVTTRATLSVKP